MPKKKEQLINNSDFTLDDCANALKHVTRKKKATIKAVPVPDLSWDEQEDFDLIEEIDSEGTKTFVYKKQETNINSDDNINASGINYPEIVWYLISPYIEPDDIGSFSRINRSTYAITMRESFWRSIYKRYCDKNHSLPKRLRIESNDKAYGLRHRVIRALYHTYDVFIKRVIKSSHDSKPHSLIKRRCVSAWYGKGPVYWSAYFKLKKPLIPQRKDKLTLIDEMGRIDANPEEDAKVLQVVCQSCHNIPPIMGMILSSVNVYLSQGLHQHKVHLGFNSGQHITSNVQPECLIVLDTVVNINILDWWHPRYPHFVAKVPALAEDEDDRPVLNDDFFSID